MRLADAQLSIEGNVVVARLIGEIDMSNAGGLSRALANSAPDDAAGMVLDLQKVDYIDSAGIQFVYMLSQQLRDRGQALRLTIARGSLVEDALRLAGAVGHIGSAETVEQALELVRRNAPAPAAVGRRAGPAAG